MKYCYKVEGDLRISIMPEVYYRNRDNRHEYIINMVRKTYWLERVLILIK